MRRPRFTTSRMMIAVAAAALLFAVMRLADELRYWTFSNGWNTSVLGIGQPVMVCEDVHSGDAIIRRGTRCIVVSDPPDEDSAYPHRKVTVQIIEDRRRGAVCDVERSLLRVQ
jgi:hypothetical protein